MAKNSNTFYIEAIINNLRDSVDDWDFKVYVLEMLRQGWNGVLCDGHAKRYF